MQTPVGPIVIISMVLIMLAREWIWPYECKVRQLNAAMEIEECGRPGQQFPIDVHVRPSGYATTLR